MSVRKKSVRPRLVALSAYEMCRKGNLSSSPTTRPSERSWNETLEMLYAKDKTIAAACHYMFQRNNMEACERCLETHQEDIGSSFCIALLHFVRYVFSLKKNIADVALSKAETCCQNSAKVFKSGNFLSGIWTVRRPKSIRESGPEKFRARFMNSMSTLLMGLLQLTTKSLAGMLKGVVTIRDAYKKLHELEKIVMESSGDDITEARSSSCSDVAEPSSSPFDLNTVNGIYLGFGGFRTILSLLSPRMASMAAMVGLDGGDYDEGMTLLMKSYASRTLYSPFASITILIIRSQRCGCCPFICKEELGLLEPIERDIESSDFSDSVLHLWPLVKVKRLKHDLDGSISLSSRCSSLYGAGEEQGGSAQALASVRVNTLEDHALSLIIRGDWLEAYNIFVLLEEESEWSRLVFVYCQACCLEMLLLERPQRDHLQLSSMITAAYWRAAHRKSITFGAKSQSVNYIVVRRLAEILRAHSVAHPNPTHQTRYADVTAHPPGVFLRNVVSLPGYELLILFSLCHQVPSRQMAVITSRLDQRLDVLAEKPPDKMSEALAYVVESREVQHRLARREAETIRKTAHMPEGADMMVLLAVQAALQAHGPACKERTAVAKRREGIVRILSSAPVFAKEAGTECSISYVLPFIEYCQAVAAFCSNDLSKCTRLLAGFTQKYAERNFFLVEELNLSVGIASKYLERTRTNK